MQNAANEDTDLVRLVLAGDQDAFAQLVERYQSKLFALVRHYTRNAVEVEDIVQDTFLKAYSRLDSFQHQSSFYTWIYRIATNTILDVLKRRGRSPIQAVEDVEVVEPAGESGGDGLPVRSRVPTPSSSETRSARSRTPSWRSFPRSFEPC